MVVINSTQFNLITNLQLQKLLYIILAINICVLCMPMFYGYIIRNKMLDLSGEWNQTDLMCSYAFYIHKKLIKSRLN